MILNTHAMKKEYQRALDGVKKVCRQRLRYRGYNYILTYTFWKLHRNTYFFLFIAIGLSFVH